MNQGKEAAFPTCLWDLLPQRARERDPAKPRKSTQAPAGLAPTAPPSRRATRHGNAVARSARQKRYDELVREMKRRFHIRVRKWRSRSSGCAWCVHYADGTITRLIEAPFPRGPMSAAIFLHEVGHHAIGFYRYKPRCLEEYMAWQWALNMMQHWGLSITPTVRRRVDDALRYAVAKAQRRGLRRIPLELQPYL